MMDGVCFRVVKMFDIGILEIYFCGDWLDKKLN